MNDQTILGIDPGLKNTAFCLIDNNLNVLEVGLAKASFSLIDSLLSFSPSLVVLERFVHFQSRPIDIEKINRFIGAVHYAFDKITNVILIRSVEWQTELLKEYKKLPRIFGKNKRKEKFSARKFAKEVFNKTFKTEHEADAFLMAVYGLKRKCFNLKFGKEIINL